MKSTSGQDPRIRTLLVRLERIPVDSPWAHRASGIRGALLEAQAVLERGETFDQDDLQFLIDNSFKLLEYAAMERGSRSPTGLRNNRDHP
jgi:hypothetical protein